MKFTALATIYLLTIGANAGFTLKDDKKWYGTGCSMKIDNVCGCTKKLNINHAYACDTLPNVYTHGKVCGGHWTLQTAKNKPHVVQYRAKGGCRRSCEFGELDHNANCD